MIETVLSFQVSVLSVEFSRLSFQLLIFTPSIGFSEGSGCPFCEDAGRYGKPGGFAVDQQKLPAKGPTTKNRELRTALLICFLQQDHVGDTLKARDGQSLPIGRPTVTRDLLGVKVSERVPG